ncbi:MAG: type II secretion system F family protein [Clostridia bacterium]|nr:type II secretion system F family protein [Clostridia bacterium]
MAIIGGKKKKRIMSSEELSSFCDQIALMLSSGMTLRDGIEMLAEDEMKEKNPKVHPYSNLYKVVDETGSLYVAMKENEEDWPSYMIEMVDIGEQTGRLEDIMHSLSTYYQREGRIRSAAVSAITYPLVLGVMLVIIIGVLLWRVLPIFTRVLESLGVDASSSGSVLMRIGTIVGWAVLILIALIVVLAIVIAILLKTKARNKVLKFLKNLFPPVRKLTEKLSASRVAGILGLMLSSGFPMENALQMAPAALADQESIDKVNFIREEMKKDETFSDALSKSGLFADFHNRMLKVGAASGHEPQVMDKIAEIYEEQVEDGLDHLISIVEPTLVALLSIVIGAILLSVMLPMAGVLSAM